MPTIQDFPFGAFVVEAAFLGDTATFALGDGTVRRVSGAAAESTNVHGGAILSAARSLDGKTLVTGGDDGVVAATDAAGKVVRVAERPRKWIDQIAAGPGGAVAFAAGRQAFVKLADGRERTFDHARAVGGLAFAPKGLRLAVARYDGVTLWWAGTEGEPVSLDWKGAHIAVTFSPDGRNVVTAMQENALHGWRLDDGKDMRMSGYPAKPRSLSWSAKGRFLASSGANAAILWPFHHQGRADGQPAAAARRARGAGDTGRLPPEGGGGGGRLSRRHGACRALRRRRGGAAAAAGRRARVGARLECDPATCLPSAPKRAQPAWSIWPGRDLCRPGLPRPE